MVIIDGIQNYLGDLVYNILYGIYYFIFGIIVIIITFISQIINNFISLYNAFTGLLSNLTGFLSTFLADLIPFAWITLILIGFFIVFVIRIYNLIRGR